METRRLRHRGTIPGALLGDHVHEHRAICGQARREHFLQLVDVVSVNRRRAHDAQLLEDHGVGNDELLHRFLRVAPEVHEGAAEGARLLHSLLHAVARRAVRRRCAQIAKVLHECADVARDGHLVVVQDNDHGKLGLPDVVERLEGHASA